MHCIVVDSSKVHQTKYGAFPHAEMIGKQFGTKVLSFLFRKFSWNNTRSSNVDGESQTNGFYSPGSKCLETPGLELARVTIARHLKIILLKHYLGIWYSVVWILGILYYVVNLFLNRILKLRVWVYTFFMVFSFYLRLTYC